MSRSASRGKVATFHADVSFPCPFCSGTVSASAREGAVVHTMPVCAKFDVLDAIAFMEACNDEKIKQRAN